MIRPSLTLLALLLTLPASTMSQTTEQRKKEIEDRESSPPSKEALERKARSITLLRKDGVPVIDHLPVIDDSQKAKKRGPEEIAHRSIAVCITALKGEGLDQAAVNSLVAKFGADKFFSAEEAAFIKDPAPKQADLVKFSWRYECAWVLAWSLGYVDELKGPDKICDVPKLVTVFRDHDTAQLIRDAKLRPLSEILDQADFIYRCHWAVTEARVKGKEVPATLEKGVVQERHYALNWLIGYMNQEWDAVSTDT